MGPAISSLVIGILAILTASQLAVLPAIGLSTAFIAYSREKQKTVPQKRTIIITIIGFVLNGFACLMFIIYKFWINK